MIGPNCSPMAPHQGRRPPPKLPLTPFLAPRIRFRLRSPLSHCQIALLTGTEQIEAKSFLLLLPRKCKRIMLLQNMDLCPPSPDSCPNSPAASFDSPPSSPIPQAPFSCAGTIYEPLLSPLLPWSSPPIERSPTPCPKPLPSLQAQLEALVTLGDAVELDNFLKKTRGRGVCLDFLCPRTGLAPLHRACISVDGVGVGRVLLQHGASPSLLSSEGWAPLHLASSAGNTALLLMLLAPAKEKSL